LISSTPIKQYFDLTNLDQIKHMKLQTNNIDHLHVPSAPMALFEYVNGTSLGNQAFLMSPQNADGTNHPGNIYFGGTFSYNATSRIQIAHDTMSPSQIPLGCGNIAAGAPPPSTWAGGYSWNGTTGAWDYEPNLNNSNC